jgi:hypothetical protein
MPVRRIVKEESAEQDPTTVNNKLDASRRLVGDIHTAEITKSRY